MLDLRELIGVAVRVQAHDPHLLDFDVVVLLQQEAVTVQLFLVHGFLDLLGAFPIDDDQGFALGSGCGNLDG